ncbi:hypothetical protein [Mycobacterium leprae]|nr:hypothetical protein [Mycobacterium leprae]
MSTSRTTLLLWVVESMLQCGVVTEFYVAVGNRGSLVRGGVVVRQ